MIETNDTNETNENNTSAQITTDETTQATDKIINDNIKEKLRLLPEKPGVYFMKDKNGNVIYVGKAKSLKKRVSSYFNKAAKDFKTEVMVSHICDLDYIATENEVEAIILEAELIQKRQPHYNILLKDQKSFPFIAITREMFPRVLKVRNIAKHNKLDRRYKYHFGPFIDIGKGNTLLRFIEHTIALRNCKLVFPLKKDKTPCLNYHIKKCHAPCAGKISESEYDKMIEEARLLLEGNVDELIKVLEEKMREYAKNLNFEMAKKVRDDIEALNFINVKQNVSTIGEGNKDIIGIYGEYGNYCIVILLSRNGRLIDRQSFYIEAIGEVSDILRSFIMQYYQELDKYVEDIIISANSIDTDDIESINAWFKSRDTKVFLLKKDETDFGLLRIANENARLSFEEYNVTKKIPEGIIRLKELFNFKAAPMVIESFDIAHLSGKYTMAGMVRFVNGKSDNKNYRLFNIKSHDNIDDFASIEEAVYRRYKRLRDERKQFPDLILIDGGRGQLNSAIKALKDIGISGQKIVAIAKRFEEIYLPNRDDPIQLAENDIARLFLQKVRDETHRFVNTNHGNKRNREMLRSELEGIDGVGKKTIERLYSVFVGIDDIKNATIEELSSIAGISERVALAIYKHFH